MLDIEDVHSIQIEILKKIIDICHQEKICYFLIGGSMLGAVRHKGFIPWDDDIDIGMLRPDYDRFIQLTNRFEAPLMLQTFETDREYPLTLAKIVDTSIAMKEPRNKNKSTKTGIYIDIFPFDKMGDSALKKKIQLSHYYFYNGVLEMKLGWTEQSYKLKIKAALIKLRGMDNTAIEKKRTEVLMQYDADRNIKQYYNVSSQYGPEREMLTENEVNDLIDVPFENLTVKIPKAYDQILKRQYGNYMQLPDEAEQHSKHFE